MSNRTYVSPDCYVTFVDDSRAILTKNSGSQTITIDAGDDTETQPEKDPWGNPYAE